MKLALGTVQFGLNYGISNQSGQISKSEGLDILEYARKADLDTLDTAIGYGNSEKSLGNIGLDGWHIITKLPEIPNSCSDIEKWIFESVNAALCRLKVKKLYGLLLHRPMQLMDRNGETIFNSLKKLKYEGLVKKIGISIYDTTELDVLCEKFQFDIVQAPFNVLDGRLIDTGWLSRFDKLNIELHVRSVYLQGLLLMKPEERPEKFNRWSSIWRTYDKWILKNKMDPIQACLKYALSFKEINKVIIGVDSLAQLKEAIKAADGVFPEKFNTLRTDDVNLLNPAHWDSL